MGQDSEEVFVAGEGTDHLGGAGAGVLEDWRDPVSDSTPQYKASKPERDQLQVTQQMNLSGTSLFWKNRNQGYVR